MKRFLAGLLCSAMLCTEILSASVFAATNTELAGPEELISIEEIADATSVEGQKDAAVEELELNGQEADDEDIVLGDSDVADITANNTDEALADEDEDILAATFDQIDGKSNVVGAEDSLFKKTTDGSTCFSVSENRLCFGTKDDGTEYTYIPWDDIIIPSYVDANDDGIIEDDEFVRIIPTGIFDDSSDRGSITSIKVKFAENAQITEIEEEAFRESSLYSITFPAPAYKTYIAGGKVRVELDSNERPVYCKLEKILPYTFKDSTVEVANLDLATGITEIGKEAFAGAKLKKFTAPEKLKLIKESAFLDCSALTILMLNNVVIIEKNAFKNCRTLGTTARTVTFTNSLRAIGDNAFEGCGFGILDMSEAPYLGKCVTGGAGRDENDIYANNYFADRGEEYVALGKGIFKSCGSMTQITLPLGYDVAGISEEMFSGCTKLATVNFSVGDGTTPYFGNTIGKKAFENCSALVSIAFPRSIQYINKMAFAGCSKLKEIEIANPNIKSDDIAEDAFPTNDTIITVKGTSDGLEKYCQEHSKVVKFKNIAQENTITYYIPNATYVASVSKAKYLDEVTIKITPEKGYALSPNSKTQKLISAIRKAKNEKEYEKDIKLTLIACDDKSQTFSFIMPFLDDKDDKLVITANVISDTAYKADEKSLTVSVPVSRVGIEEYVTLSDDYIAKGCFDGKSIKFKKTGEQVPLLFEDAKDRKIGPWRFKFDTTDSTVATVTSDGVVTAKTNADKKGAQITATLISTGTVVTIPVSVEESVEIDEMGFQFYRVDKKNNRVIYELPSRVSEVPGGVWKYEEVTRTIDGEKVTTKEPFLYQLIVVPRTKVKKGAVTFTTEALPMTSKDSLLDKSAYVVDSVWTSRDTSIATVEKKNVVDNMNKITIAKGAVGETEIRVSVTNTQLDKEDDNYKFEYGFVIRVEDDIPRLTEKSFTINTYKEKGYDLKIVEGYKSGADNNIKYEIADHKLWVTKADGTDFSSDFLVTYDDEEQKYYIKETDKVRKAIKEGESKKYTKLKLCGQIKNNDDVSNEGLFDIDLGTIIVEKVALESEISVKGTINTFYDARYEDADHSYSGKVTLYQSNWDEKVEKYYLVTAEHHEEIQKKERTVEIYQGVDSKGKFYDELRANFTFGYINETTGTVPIYRTRTEKLAQNDDGEDVVSGYVYIKYEGYSDYLFKEITIPVKKSKPSYTLDVTSGTASTLQRKQEYNVLLVKKDTKKLPVRDLLNPDGTAKKDSKGVVQREYVDLLNEKFVDDEGVVTSEARYWFDADTDRSIFDTDNRSFAVKTPKYVDLNDSKKKDEREYRSIPIKVTDPYPSKAYIWVQLYNWSEPIKYTFTLKTTSKIATATVKPAKVTLYASTPNTPAEFKVTLNQKFAKLHVENITENGIKVTFEQDPDNPYICIGKAEFKNGAVPKNNYRFITYGKAQYGEGGDDIVDLAKPIKFTVAVTEKLPTISLKSNTYKMNSKVAGVELVGSKYTLKNLPVGDNEYAIISDNSTRLGHPMVKGAKFECITKNPKTKEVYSNMNDKLSLYLGRSKKDGDIDTLMVGLKELESGVYENRTYTFKVNGVQVTDKYNNTIDLKEFKIKVTIKKSAISVTQKTSGTINPIDPKSDTIYRPTFKNFGNVKIISANFIEKNSYGNSVSKQHFKLTSVSQDTLDKDKMQNIAVDANGVVLDNQYMLTGIDGVEIEKGKTYYGIIRYTYQDVDGKTGTCDTKKFKVALKQKLPSVTPTFTSPKSADSVNMSTVMYSGSDKDQVCMLRVMPKAQTNAKFESIEVYAPTAKEANIKRAFEPRLLKVEPAKGETAKATRAIRMCKNSYAVYALIDGNLVQITKPAGYTVSANDVDPTSNKKYAYVPQVFDADTVGMLVDGGEYTYYRNAVAQMQEEEWKYYRSFSSNTNYEKKDGHYYINVELLNASAVTKNVETEVTFEVKYKNQIKKTNGTKVKINVTLKK